MDMIECAGFQFIRDFDSSNLAKVEHVPQKEIPVNPGGKLDQRPIDFEFNIWTRPDCAGTEYENGNRTWFYFGIKANLPAALVKLNIIDINKQAKMYSQGMAPVYKIIPGKPTWDRIRDKLTYSTIENVFSVSFKYKTSENLQSTTYFAFTYPYSYTDLQTALQAIDEKFLLSPLLSKDDIYYTRENVCNSIEGRRVDLLTISSYHNMSGEREPRLENLFQDKSIERPFRFIGKKVIFVSARVHPGETPSTFVLNGFLQLLLTREDLVAIALRRQYVFKLIPFLNPDGVSRGHYRTDTRGTNLNRVYLRPSRLLHPTVYAARAIIRYHHYGYEKPDIIEPEEIIIPTTLTPSTGDIPIENTIQNNDKLMSVMTLEEKHRNCKEKCGGDGCSSPDNKTLMLDNIKDSGLSLYIDMHGHASKKGIFMYGNHFDDLDNNVDCMLLPKIMSINNHNFHFTACNFTERNMYLRDRRDGMSREGSGRVSVLKLTGLVRSYTLECNYNTGRIVNVLPPTIREASAKSVYTLPVPPKYSPQVFEEVGRALGASILDLTAQNPLSRLPNSEFHSLSGLREWLHTNCSLASSTVSNVSCRRLLLSSGRFVRPVPGAGAVTTRRSVSAAAAVGGGGGSVTSANTVQGTCVGGGGGGQGRLLRNILLKTRGTGTTSNIKYTPKKHHLLPKVGAGRRSISVNTTPVDRKENMVTAPPQPSCSNASPQPASTTVVVGKKTTTVSTGINTTTTTNRHHHRATTTQPVRLGNKSRKVMVTTNSDKVSTSNNKSRAVHLVRQKLRPAVDKPSTSSAVTLDNSSPVVDCDKNRVKLREICFIKDQEGGKTVIAKYKTGTTASTAEVTQDNLIVTWNPNNSNAQVYSQRSTSASAPFMALGGTTSSIGTVRGKPAFRVHNFTRGGAGTVTSYAKKRSQRLLRRLAVAAAGETGGKMDKVKRKRKKLRANKLT